MSRRKEGAFKNFLVQEGYLLAFTVIAGLSLFSYFLANSNFAKQNSMEVLGTSTIRGVWVQSGIEGSYLDMYESITMQELYFDDEGKVLFSNDDFSITAVFDIKELINDDVWSNLYVGDLNFKINEKQWVFESVVWDKKGSSSLISLVNLDGGYLIVLHPTVSLTGREKQFWAFKYETIDSVVKSLSFLKGDLRRAFIDSTYIELLSREGTVFIKFERDDPSLIDKKEVVLYKYGTDLEYFKRLLVDR